MSVASTWLRRHAKVIGLIGGLLLIAIGVCEITGLVAHVCLVAADPSALHVFVLTKVAS
jgi:hypothetical protein